MKNLNPLEKRGFNKLTDSDSEKTIDLKKASIEDAMSKQNYQHLLDLSDYDCYLSNLEIQLARREKDLQALLGKSHGVTSALADRIAKVEAMEMKIEQILKPKLELLQRIVTVHQ